MQSWHRRKFKGIGVCVNVRVCMYVFPRRRLNADVAECRGEVAGCCDCQYVFMHTCTLTRKKANDCGGEVAGCCDFQYVCMHTCTLHLLVYVCMHV